MMAWGSKLGRRGLWAASVLMTGVLLLGCAHPAGEAGTASASGSAGDETDARRRARIRLELAANYLQMGQHNVALEEIRQALTTDPSYADAYHLRGLAYMGMGDLVQAEEGLKRAQSMKPADPDILHNYGWLHCQRQQYEQANQWFERALATPGYTARGRTYLSQGMCYQRAGRIAEAEQALQRAYEIDPGNPVAGYHLASVLFARGDAKRAQFYIRRVNNGEFSSAESLWLGVRVERALKEFVAMRQLGEQLRKRFPQSKEAAAFERGAFDE